MAITYKAIATVTVGSGGANSIAFTNIPNTYTDLSLKLSGRTTASNVFGTILMKVNDSTSNYASKFIFSAGSGNIGGGTYGGGAYTLFADIGGANATASTFGSATMYMPNYTSSNTKTWHIDQVSENNGTEAYIILLANAWDNSSAITKIDIYAETGDFAQYSAATLYGISHTT